MPVHFNIVARTNGVGLDRDIDLIYQAAIAVGHEVTVSHCRGISPLFATLPPRPFHLRALLQMR